VGSRQIKRAAVTKSDLRGNAITSPKVKNRSLRARDFAAGQLPAGAPGAQGAPGATGPTGPQGPRRVVGAITVQRSDFTIADAGVTSIAVSCPAGTTIIGGGSALVNTGADDVALTASRPERTAGDPPSDGETFDRWRVAYDNPTGGVTGSTMARAFAVCAET
jgi:hypothetical protein